MKYVSTLMGWSVVVLLLLVGGANVDAKPFQQTPDEDSRTLQPTPKASSNKRLTIEESLKSSYANSPRLNYYYLNMDVPYGLSHTRSAMQLLFEGKYDEAIENLKELLPTQRAMVYCLESPQKSSVFYEFYDVLQTMAAAYELKGDWQTVREIYFLIHRDSKCELIEWLDIRSQYAFERTGHDDSFRMIIDLLSRKYSSLDVDKTLRRAEESKDKPELWDKIPIDENVYDDEDIRVYALKDRLAHIVCPKLHFTYPEPWLHHGSLPKGSLIKQAELSHESYLKFLETMEEEYEKYKAQDPSTVRPELRNAETVEKVMTMLRKIGELPY
ncbi:MAG: hypothetical protein II150_06050 [Thermoguttaceae bacterium]|nr:hypothetical protein [Thermoguttaceae bacterium]